MDFFIKVPAGVPLQVPTGVLIRVSKAEKEKALLLQEGVLRHFLYSPQQR
jgi:hypothetical protein